MKNKFLIISITMIIVLVVIAGWQYFPETQSLDDSNLTTSVVLDSEPIEKNLEAPQPTEQSMEAIQPDETSNTILTADDNGISAEINDYDLDPEHPFVTVCTNLPSVADWLPIFTATYNDESIDVWMVQVLDEDNTAYKSINRCYKALLKEGIIQADKPGILTFTMDHFRMAIPDVYPDELIEKSNKFLAENGNNVVFEIKNVNHGQVFEITQKPENMSDEQAYQLIEQAIDQSIEKVFGPWTFTIKKN